VREGATVSLADQIDAEATAIAAAAKHPQGREGMRAFTERRKPKFPGA